MQPGCRVSRENNDPSPQGQAVSPGLLRARTPRRCPPSRMSHPRARAASRAVPAPRSPPQQQEKRRADLPQWPWAAGRRAQQLRCPSVGSACAPLWAQDVGEPEHRSVTPREQRGSESAAVGARRHRSHAAAAPTHPPQHLAPLGLCAIASSPLWEAKAAPRATGGPGTSPRPGRAPSPRRRGDGWGRRQRLPKGCELNPVRSVR